MAQGANRSLPPRFFQLFLWPLDILSQSSGYLRLLVPSVPLPEPPLLAPPPPPALLLLPLLPLLPLLLPPPLPPPLPLPPPPLPYHREII